MGFDPSPVSQDGVARPELKAYFTSRCACMGQVPGEVVAATFGVFNPKVVVPAVQAGWQIADREAILQAREQGATAMLARVLGEQPDGLGRVTDLLRRAAEAAPWAGRPICGGLRSLGFPGHPLGDLWRAADLVREHRGDSHVISWAVGGPTRSSAVVDRAVVGAPGPRLHADPVAGAAGTWTPASSG